MAGMNQFEFVETAIGNFNNRAILDRLPELKVDDAWLVSGAIFQTIWNKVTGRPPTHGIKDYDIFYFDPDTTWEAEDAVIKRADALFDDLGVDVEVRNQGRVHLWYQEKFGSPYPSLTKSTDGIDRFLCDCAMVGMRYADTDTYGVYAPRGHADIEDLIVRPNRMPNFHPERYREKAARWKEVWPEITIIAP
jgi:hypothetical protein